MSDPSTIVSYLWQILQYGGLAIAAVGVFIYIFAKKNNNDDLSSTAIWIILGGVVGFGIGSFMGSQTLPSL